MMPVQVKDVVTIGESMLRFAAPEGESLERVQTLRVDVAGTESNLAINLSRLGMFTGWISRLVDNPLGRRIVYDLRANGVDVSRVIWTESGRIGIYYLEPGASPRPSHMYYDRARSAMAEIDPAEVDWDYVSQASLVHLTGITPALSPSCKALIQQAIHRAKKAGQLISFDVNYRSRLWSPDEARDCLESMLSALDIVLCGRQDAQQLFGLSGDAAETAKALVRQFAMKVAVVTDDERGAAAYTDGQSFTHPAYPVKMVDPIGAGDAFAAGFICGYLEAGVEYGLALGNAMAALKLTYRGDISWSLRRDVERLIEQGSSDRDVIR